MNLEPRDASLKARLSTLMVLCLGLAFVVLGRAAYIQLYPQPKLESLARRQFETHSLVKPRRGAILDRNGEALAIGVESYSLAANPVKIRRKKNLARLLAKTLGLPAKKVLLKLQEKREFVWVKRHLSEDQTQKFKKLRMISIDDEDDGDLNNGLWLVKEGTRVYPHRQLASQTLGDVNIDSDGIEGVELWFNEVLRGKVVSVDAVRDALGRPTFIDADAAKTLFDGESVKLSLDVRLQYEVEQALRMAIVRTGAASGSVVAMEANTGEILAVANEPTFSRRRESDRSTPVERRRNRALTDGYEPGSVLKTLLVASALSHGWKLSDKVWGEKGSFVLQNHKISEAEAHEKFEWISLKKIIQVSSNIGAAKVALRMGSQRYYETLKLFGLGSKTGSGFPGEISGKLSPPGTWGALGLANIGFGQGVLVTPLQIVRAYAAILNGGWLVTPTFLSSSEPAQRQGPRIISSSVSHDLLEALATVTEKDGTGTEAALPGYRVAGKTGTSQLVDPKTKKYSRDKHVASFVGFALGVEPKIVIYTSLTEPKGIYYGGKVAAPLFREVLASVVNRFGLPADPNFSPPPKTQVLALTDVLTSSSSSIAEVPAEEAGPLVLQDDGADPEAPAKWVLPSLIGLTPREALLSLAGHDLKLQVTGEGLVTSQHPAPGGVIGQGGVVRLKLSDKF